MSASRFYNAVPDKKAITGRDLVAYFVYYLTVEQGEETATAAAVDQCFQECDLSIPTRTAQYLNEGISSKPQRFVKSKIKGYRLHKHYADQLSASLGEDRTTHQTNVELRRLELTVPAGAKRGFLTETIDCFEAGANRAAVIMCWVLTMDHLFDHVWRHKLAAFNAALAANPAGKLTAISAREQLSELKESKFIELLRAAGIISNDVRKILDEKLGTRNSSAHPSSVTIKSSKVVDFVDDLITNVVLKFPD